MAQFSLLPAPQFVSVWPLPPALREMDSYDTPNTHSNSESSEIADALYSADLAPS